MNLFEIVYKNGSVHILAENKEEAYAKFFKMIVDHEISLDDIGHVIILKEDGKEYPFRTVPTLYNLGIMDRRTAVVNLSSLLGIPLQMSDKLLFISSEEDKWVADKVKEMGRND